MNDPIYKYIKGQGWVPESPEPFQRPGDWIDELLDYVSLGYEPNIQIRQEMRWGQFVISAATEDNQRYYIAVTCNGRGDPNPHELEVARQSLVRAVRAHNESLRLTTR